MLHREEGQTALEYSLVIAVVTVGVCALLLSFFDDIVLDAKSKVDALIL